MEDDVNKTHRKSYTLIGGPCDGQQVMLDTYWIGGYWQGPPHVFAEEIKPLAIRKIEDVEATTRTLQINTYVRKRMTNSERIPLNWDEYHYEKPRQNPLKK